MFDINLKLIASTDRGDSRACLSAIQDGADVNSKDNHGQFTLFFAAKYGHPDIGYAARIIWRMLVLAWVPGIGTPDDFRQAWAARVESRFAQEHRVLTEAQQRINQMASHSKHTEKDKAVR